MGDVRKKTTVTILSLSIELLVWNESTFWGTVSAIRTDTGVG